VPWFRALAGFINHDKLLSRTGLPILGPLEMNLMNSPLTFFSVLMFCVPYQSLPPKCWRTLAPKKKKNSRVRASLIFNTTTNRVLNEAKHTEDWPRRDSRDRPTLTPNEDIRESRETPRSRLPMSSHLMNLCVSPLLTSPLSCCSLPSF
jgi:hypothetical protein